MRLMGIAHLFWPSTGKYLSSEAIDDRISRGLRVESHEVDFGECTEWKSRSFTVDPEELDISKWPEKESERLRQPPSGCDMRKGSKHRDSVVEQELGTFTKPPSSKRHRKADSEPVPSPKRHKKVDSKPPQPRMANEVSPEGKHKIHDDISRQEQCRRKGFDGSSTYDRLGYELDKEFIINNTCGRPRPLGKRAMKRLDERGKESISKAEIMGISNKDVAPSKKASWDDGVARDLRSASHEMSMEEHEEWRNKGFRAEPGEFEKLSKWKQKTSMILNHPSGFWRKHLEATDVALCNYCR